MPSRTWSYVFNSLLYLGAFGIVLYYFKPDWFSPTPTGQSPILYAVGVYFLLWLLVALLYYIYGDKTEYAEVIGLWEVAPENTGQATVYEDGTMVKRQGKADLLSEYQVSENMSESFTFGFFVSIDNGTIETVKGDDLKTQRRPYQQVIMVPGAYNIMIDPIHEVLKISFVSYDAKTYDVTIPTLSVRRWHQILICVEGRTADLYQNGVLLKSVPLPNVINARPGKPTVFLNSDMYARVAFIQSWPRRISEKEVNNNYRWNVDDQGIPPLPKPNASFLFGIPMFNFCLGSFCIDSIKPQENALTYVDYLYA